MPPAAAAAGAGLHLIRGPVGSEDIVHLPGTQWLIASGLNLGAPAQLYLVDAHTKLASTLLPSYPPLAPEGRRDVADRGSPPQRSRMSTDGLALRSGSRGTHVLYAANHGDRAAIEMFAVDTNPALPRLSWIGCAPLPANAVPNAVRPLPAEGLLVICPFDPTDPHYWARMARGEHTGCILEWRAERGFNVLPGSAMSGGNGLEVSADGNWVYASAWSARELVVLSRRDGSRRTIPLDFMPDNIHALADGSLLVAGQRTTVEAIAACTGLRCPQPWVVARVDPHGGDVRELLAGEGTTEVDYACGALVVGETMYVTVRGDRCIAYQATTELPPLV